MLRTIPAGALFAPSLDTETQNRFRESAPTSNADASFEQFADLLRLLSNPILTYSQVEPETSLPASKLLLQPHKVSPEWHSQQGDALHAFSSLWSASAESPSILVPDESQHPAQFLGIRSTESEPVRIRRRSESSFHFDSTPLILNSPWGVPANDTKPLLPSAPSFATGIPTATAPVHRLPRMSTSLSFSPALPTEAGQIDLSHHLVAKSLTVDQGPKRVAIALPFVNPLPPALPAPTEIPIQVVISTDAQPQGDKQIVGSQQALQTDKSQLHESRSPARPDALLTSIQQLPVESNRMRGSLDGGALIVHAPVIDYANGSGKAGPKPLKVAKTSTDVVAGSRQFAPPETEPAEELRPTATGNKSDRQPTVPVLTAESNDRRELPAQASATSLGKRPKSQSFEPGPHETWTRSPVLPMAETRASKDAAPSESTSTAGLILQHHVDTDGNGPTTNAPRVTVHHDHGPTIQETLVGRIADYVGRARMFSEPDSVRFELQVDPPELGRLRISLSDSSDGLVARIVANHERAFRLLEQDLPALRQSLHQAGVANVDVGISHDAGGGGHWNGFERPPPRPVVKGPAEEDGRRPSVHHRPQPAVGANHVNVIV